MFTTEHLMVSGLLYVRFKNPRNVKLMKWFKKKKMWFLWEVVFSQLLLKYFIYRGFKEILGANSVSEGENHKLIKDSML